MSMYTYVVQHDEDPRVVFGEKINGGVLKAVMFDDAFFELEKLQELVECIKNRTTNPSTQREIEQTLLEIHGHQINRLQT